MIAIGTLAFGCNQSEENNDEETIAALLLLRTQSGRATTCNVTLSGFSQGAPSNVPAVPITYVDNLNSEVTVKFGDVPNTTHKIGAINVTARVGTELTIAGGNFYSVVFEKGLGCPIGDADKQTKDTDFTYSAGNVTNSAQTFNQDLVTASVVIRFSKAGNFFITPYLLQAGPVNQLSTEGNLKARITKL